MTKLSKVWILALILLVAPARSSVAETIYVDTNAATPAPDGSSWCDAYLHLQDALAAAALPGATINEIRVADGLYKPDQGGGQTPGDREATFQLLNGVTIAGGYAGCGAPDPNERDIAGFETILSGDLAGDDVEVPVEDLLDEPTRTENSCHVVTGSKTNETAILAGCIIVGGNAYGYASLSYGGGMYNAYGTPTVTDCAFRENSAKYNGGGMSNSRSDLTVANCTFSGNTAGAGGGMYNGRSNATVINCIFSGNSAKDGGGMVNNSGSPAVTNCLFTGNSADEDGGGMLNARSYSIVSHCTFSGNAALRNGRAMYNTRSNPTVTSCIFWGDAPQGIANFESSPRITYSNVQGGHAGVGNIASDPMFVDARGGDWRLRSESPCIDAGNNDAVPEGADTDLDGNPRFADHACTEDAGSGSDAIVDMGAYELPDHAACGNGVCDTGETCETCACDCGGCCGDGSCSIYEDCLTCPGDCACETIHVPGDYEGIQAAIDASRSGDEIVVAPGTYYEAIDFLGKAIALRSSGGSGITTIDATGFDSPVAKCVSGEGRDTSLEGFTLTGGNASIGGGMYNSNSSAVVTSCNFSGNTAGSGGGMYNWHSNPTVTNCTFAGNSVADDGGGMYNDSSSPTVINCTFHRNSARLYGGGMYNNYGEPTVTNCILWGNFPQEITDSSSSPTIAYSNVQGGYAGVGNIESDPMFANAGAGDWQLRSGSPCIDAGDNDAIPEGIAVDFAGDSRFADHACANDVGNPGVPPRPIVDMGAYEFPGRPTCGNGLCDDGETCETCACDCGDCCGDGICATHEDCVACTDDCACETIHVPGDYGSIQEAINASRDGDEVIVAPGTYYEAIDLLGKSITLRGADGPDVTTIDASGLAGPVVACVWGEGEDTLLDGFALMGGNETKRGGLYNFHSSPTVINCTFIGNSGGGMNNTESSPTVTNCTFSGNSVADYGGGMFNYRSNPTVANCTFNGNSANGSGAGMYNILSRPLVTDCDFTENSAGAHGGGMHSRAGAPTVTNCTFRGNSAEHFGGGIHHYDSDATVMNCTFSGNTSGGYGGGMYNAFGGPTVTNCLFIGNEADGATPDGGGMYNFYCSPTMTNCAFNGNIAYRDGGGMCNSYSTPTVTNCTFDRNSAERSGGGIYSLRGAATLSSCRFVGNSAGEYGGAMYNGASDSIVTNCTFSGNLATRGGGTYNTGSDLTATNCSFSGNLASSGAGGIYVTVHGSAGSSDGFG